MLNGIIKCIVYTGIFLMIISLPEKEPAEQVVLHDYVEHASYEEVVDVGYEETKEAMTYKVAQYVERCGLFVYDTLIKVVADSNLLFSLVNVSFD